MKNKREFLNTPMLLLLLLFLSPVAYTQSTKDPQRDLSVLKWSTTARTESPGSVFGDLVNSSSNTYACVRIEFDLSTRFDQLKPGEQSRHLGILSVEVQNLSPRTVQSFRQVLPYPAGIGLKGVSECQYLSSKPVPGNSKILSFTVAPPSIQAGETATLEWRTENAETVFVGVENPDLRTNPAAEQILQPRNVEASGSLKVSPSRTTTYILKIKKGSLTSYKGVTVTVKIAPRVPGVCTIFGSISRDLPGYGTTVGLYRPGGSGPPLFSKGVVRGKYTFTNVPEGEYQVRPKGRYPVGEGRGGGLAPFPRSQNVSCQPNGSHKADFKIDSTEG